MYVIINGVNSDTIRGLQILSLPPITKPKMRTSVATIDGRPGDIVTYLGYEAYNKTIKILLHDTYDLPAIMAYFNQSGTIIFSNDPDKIYTFETIEQINYERAVKFKTASVTIHVQPYKLSATEEPATGEVSTLEDRTPYIIRRTPFGTRQKGTIVGGSVVWNQLIDVISKATTANQGITYTNNGDGSFTLTGTPTSTNGFVNINYVEGVNPYALGHVYLLFSGYTGDLQIGVRIYGIDRQGWDTYRKGYSLKRATELGANGYVRFQVSNLKDTDIGTVKLTPQLIDLTLMFGPTIADYIYTQEQATEGAGVALAKAWAGITADYYPYDPGSIKSVTGLTAHKTTGYNQWDEDWEVGTINNNGENSTAITRIRSKNYIPVIQGETYYIRTAHQGGVFDGTLKLSLYDANKRFVGSPTSWYGNSTNSFFTVPEGVSYIRFFGTTSNATGTGRGPNYIGDICINISNPAKNGTYEPYDGHVYPLDSSLTLRGLPKLDGDNLYYDGDIYNPSGEVERRYGAVDLGTLAWTNGTISAGSSMYMFYSKLLTAKMTANNNEVANIVCPLYTATYRNALSGNDKVIAITNNGYLTIRDDDYTDAASFKTAMSGVYLVYELAEPTTEQAEPYTALQTCDPNGTEEWVGANMPVGHETTYIDPISMTVNNEGNTESAPSITIEGEGAVEVTVDGLIAFEINMPTTGAITIDSKTMDATDGDGNLANRSVSGDYTNLQLAPGEHTVVAVGDVSSVTMKNVSRWL